MSNLLLFFFDMLVLPVTLIRLWLIYLYGSRYDVSWLRCIDVMLHANSPQFNMDGKVATITTDYRNAVHDPDNIETIEKKSELDVITGTTADLEKLLHNNTTHLWDL